MSEYDYNDNPAGYGNYDPDDLEGRVSQIEQAAAETYALQQQAAMAQQAAAHVTLQAHQIQQTAEMETANEALASGAADALAERYGSAWDRSKGYVAEFVQEHPNVLDLSDQAALTESLDMAYRLATDEVARGVRAQHQTSDADFRDQLKSVASPAKLSKKNW